jgi:hypothetical protein
VTVADLIHKAKPSHLRAPWCVRGTEGHISTLIENGDVAAAAAILEAAAAKRGLTIVEVCRVTQGTREAAYARGEPKVDPT